MNKLKKTDFIIITVALLLIAGIVLSVFVSSKGNGKESSGQSDTEQKSATYDDYNGRRMGIRTGSSFEKLTLEYFPDSEYSYYDTDSDLVTALSTNKIDGFLDDEPVAKMIHLEHGDVNLITNHLVDDDYCFGFQKDTERSNKLRTEFNETLAALKANGELDKMNAKWFSQDDSVKTYDDSPLTGENGTILVCVIPDKVPFSYMAGTDLVGYNIELLTIFAREHGYKIEYETAPLASMLAGLSSGKYDIGAGTLSITEERKKVIDFSDPIYKGGVVLLGRTDEIGQQDNASGQAYKDFDGKRAGIRTGSSFEPITFEYFANSEYSYFDSDSDLITALNTNKIDFFLTDEPVAAMEHIQQNSVDYMHEPIMDDDYHFGFQKDTERSELLQSQFNEFIAKYKAEGKLDELKFKWIEGEESARVIDVGELTGENGNLAVSVLPDNMPFSYTANNQLVGYAVELTLEFAKEYGYSVTFEQANISACLAGLAAGKYDMNANSLSYTEERAKSIDFSDVIYEGGVVLVARSSDLNTVDDGAAKASFFSSVAESFRKNFITEGRYQLILKGIGTTSIITVLSVVFGSILAFFISLFRRTDSILANKIANFYVKLLQGTPMVVLLMILYYVVFGKSGINAIWVAVIGFSLNFGAYTSEILRSGIESIDGGQREAALALGYSENQAFFKFIFPQATVRQIPVYRGEIISLLKNTSIVGYIAIQDLTKMSDIIRSRTYEAFFPLIATAVIYFILAWIIALILNLILKKIDPKAKKARFAKEAAAK